MNKKASEIMGETVIAGVTLELDFIHLRVFEELESQR